MHRLGILNLANLYTLRVCAEMYPYIYPHKEQKQSGPQIITTHTPRSRKYTRTKRATQLVTSSHQTPSNYSKTKQPKHASAYLTQQHTDIWNGIPADIRSTKSLTIFKRSLKQKLLEEQASQLILDRQQGHHLA